jgi:hypothetical protein
MIEVLVVNVEPQLVFVCTQVDFDEVHDEIILI